MIDPSKTLTQLHENFKIYWMDILGETYGYRLLTRGELKRAQNIADGDSVVLEDVICEICTVQLPENFPGWDDCLAGIPHELAKTILDKSGYLTSNSLRELEAEAAEWAKTQDARYDSLICFCFAGTTPEILDNLPPQEWHRRAAMAQLIVAGIYNIDPAEFLNPGKETNPKSPPSVNLPQPPPSFNNKPHGINNTPTDIQNEGVFSFRNR